MTVNTTQLYKRWVAISATNATLTTALLEVITEASAQGITMAQANLSVAGGGSTVAWSVVLIAKKG